MSDVFMFLAVILPNHLLLSILFILSNGELVTEQRAFKPSVIQCHPSQ